MVTWITYDDGTEPFQRMAWELWHSINDTKAGECEVVKVDPNGGHYLIEFYSATYPIFSQAIQHGPVVVLDSDCIVRKPLDHLFEQDFAIAAIHRGECANASGRQDFLGSLIGFSPARPNLVRKLWLSWISHVYDYLEKPLVPQAGRRHENLVKKGWHENWYAGQSAYNDMLYELEEGEPGMVLRLDRKEYAAHPGTPEAYVWHMKGGRKLA